MLATDTFLIVQWTIRALPGSKSQASVTNSKLLLKSIKLTV